MSDLIAESHRGRLGCSEIAAVLGMSRWKTPYTLWLEKTGRAQPDDLKDVLRVDLGNRLESVVADLYAKQKGVKLARQSSAWTHAQIPNLIGHIDRRIIGQRAGLEIKTSLGRFPSSAWGDEGTDQIPMDYLLQVYGYLMLTEWSSWDVAALLAGPELRIYTIRPDRDLIDWIKVGIANFWNYVETDTPPGPITLKDASARWPNSIEKPVAATPPTKDTVKELCDLKLRMKAMEMRADSLEVLLKAALQDGDALVDYDTNKTLATWKSQVSTRIDIKRLRAEKPDIATEYSITTPSRVFRLKSANDE